MLGRKLQFSRRRFYHALAFLAALVAFILQHFGNAYTNQDSLVSTPGSIPEIGPNFPSLSSDSYRGAIYGRRRFISCGTGTISLPLGTRFAGRYAGGATRDSIYGASYYGSGYPYGSYGSTWVGGRPFPFYYWPVYFGPYEYYGASEYGPANSVDRPGGPMETAKVYTIDPKYNTSDVYRLLGDRDSIVTVLYALKRDCSITVPYEDVFGYDPASDNPSRAHPHIQSVIQFYRASSFALALDGYNNSAAAVTPAALRNSTGQLVALLPPPTPLPSGVNTAFLGCINRTVGSSLPIPERDSGFCLEGARNDSTVDTTTCIHFALAVILVVVLFKGLARWFPKPKQENDQEIGQGVREEGSRATLLENISHVVSIVSSFVG